MINQKVSFIQDGVLKRGIVLDKVNIPVKSGVNEYCPADYYMIACAKKNNEGEIGVYPVNPINIKTL